MLHRRDLLLGGALASASLALPSARALAFSQTGGRAAPKASRAERLAAAIENARMPIAFDGRRFSGVGYDWLLQKGANAAAFLVGEEHGISENPKLASQLFAALVPHGYRHVAVEISPPIAEQVDRILTSQGPEALKMFLKTPGSMAAFFGMQEEADWLVAARAALPGGKPFLWGLDYDVGADRWLIAGLKGMKKPRAAEAALEALDIASRKSWGRYADTKDPQYIFSFNGDPALVRTLRAAWPGLGPRAKAILDTLERTFEINAMWVAGKGYESNLSRSKLLRANLVDHWRRRRKPGEGVFFKFGSSHMVRGVNMSNVLDIGTLIPELVALEGKTSFSMMVLPGPGSKTASLDPTSLRYVAGDRGEYGDGMERFDAAVLPTGFTLFDTAPLRAVAGAPSADVPFPMWRAIRGFDAILIMGGSTPSSNL